MGIFNGFKFKEKAISLYKQGKDINQIQKEVGIVLELETVQKWVEEEKKYEQTKEYIKQSIKIKKQIKKLKNNEEELEKLYNDLKEVVSKILEINPENEIAKKDLIAASYYIEKKQRAQIPQYVKKKYRKQSIEEMQNQFGKEQLENEDAYTVEKQEDYINGSRIDTNNKSIDEVCNCVFELIKE